MSLYQNQLKYKKVGTVWYALVRFGTVWYGLVCCFGKTIVLRYNQQERINNGLALEG